MRSIASVARLDDVRARRDGVVSLPAPVRARRRVQASLAAGVLDAAMVALAVAAAAAGSEAAGVARILPVWTAAYGLLVLALLRVRTARAGSLGLRTLDDLRNAVGATTLAGLMVLAVIALVDAGQPAVDEIVRLWAFATVYVGAGRIALNRSQVQARRVGEGLRPTLIVGAGRVGRLTARRLLDAPELGLKPIGFLDKNPLAAADDDVHLPVLGASWDLEAVVREHGVEQVIVSFSTAPSDVLLRLVRRSEELGVAVAFVPRLYEHTTTSVTVDHIGGLPLLSTHRTDPDGWYFGVKYAVDRLVAALLIVLLSPLLIGAAAATWISAGRPILFRQRRVGRDHREFDMLKFRTMRGVPEERGEADADWALEQLGGNAGLRLAVAEDEDRRTPVGRFLRKSSIDELPQLFNVLLGHMSLVGPRPERPHYVRAFERDIYRYEDRHRVKSGITGWAQVNGLRGKTSLADRVEWDNYYIENFSLWLDLKILLMTTVAVVKLFRQVE